MSFDLIFSNKSLREEVETTLANWRFKSELLQYKVEYLKRQTGFTAAQDEELQKLKDLTKLLPWMETQVQYNADFIVARNSEGIQGIAIVEMTQEKKTPYLHLKFLVTSPYNLNIGINRDYGSVRKGVGAQLVQKTIEHCRHQKGRYVELMPEDSAVSFYERMEFEHVTDSKLMKFPIEQPDEINESSSSSSSGSSTVSTEDEWDD